VEFCGKPQNSKSRIIGNRVSNNAAQTPKNQQAAAVHGTGPPAVLWDNPANKNSKKIKIPLTSPLAPCYPSFVIGEGPAL
jgi:hypothetical protein